MATAAALARGLWWATGSAAEVFMALIIGIIVVFAGAAIAAAIIGAFFTLLVELVSACSGER